MEIELQITEEVTAYVAKKGFDRDYGARPIRRALQNEVEDLLAEAVLAGEVLRGGRAEIYMTNRDGKDLFKSSQKKNRKTCVSIVY